MPALNYQTGDDTNTVLRKLLENEARVLTGSLSVTTRAALIPASATAQFAQPGDDTNTLLRKYLENQAKIVTGELALKTQ